MAYRSISSALVNCKKFACNLNSADWKFAEAYLTERLIARLADAERCPDIRRILAGHTAVLMVHWSPDRYSREWPICIHILGLSTAYLTQIRLIEHKTTGVWTWKSRILSKINPNYLNNLLTGRSGIDWLSNTRIFIWWWRASPRRVRECRVIRFLLWAAGSLNFCSRKW